MYSLSSKIRELFFENEENQEEEIKTEESKKIIYSGKSGEAASKKLVGKNIIENSRATNQFG